MMSFDEAQKMFEAYWNRAMELDYVIDKVAWALYQTWLEAEQRRNVWVKGRRKQTKGENKNDKTKAMPVLRHKNGKRKE